MEPQTELQKRVKELEAYVERRLQEKDWDLRVLKDLASDALIGIVEVRKAIRDMREEFDREMERMREEFDREMTEMRRNFEEEMRASREEFDRKMAEMREESREREERFYRELAEMREEFDREMERMRRSSEEEYQKWRKKWGEISERLGRLAEDIFVPGVPYLMEGLGYQVQARFVDLEFKGHRQYDVVLLARKPGEDEVAFVVEVKSTARADDFDQLRKALEDLPERFSPVQGKRLIPVLAAMRIPEDLVPLANRRGVLLVRMGGEYLEALNPEVLP